MPDMMLMQFQMFLIRSVTVCTLYRYSVQCITYCMC